MAELTGGAGGAAAAATTEAASRPIQSILTFSKATIVKSLRPTRPRQHRRQQYSAVMEISVVRRHSRQEAMGLLLANWPLSRPQWPIRTAHAGWQALLIPELGPVGEHLVALGAKPTTKSIERLQCNANIKNTPGPQLLHLPLDVLHLHSIYRLAQGHELDNTVARTTHGRTQPYGSIRLTWSTRAYIPVCSARETTLVLHIC